jgi:hypothetical protein
VTRSFASNEQLRDEEMSGEGFQRPWPPLIKMKCRANGERGVLFGTVGSVLIHESGPRLCAKCQPQRVAKSCRLVCDTAALRQIRNTTEPCVDFLMISTMMHG